MSKKAYNCGLEAALAVIGGKWKSLILVTDPVH
jgi:DNA-binding HxlR family transcriptional regulator